MRLIRPGVKASPERLLAALTGRVTDHHCFLIGLHLRQIDALGAALTDIDGQVERDLDPFREGVGLLTTIPGVSEQRAKALARQIERLGFACTIANPEPVSI